MPIDEQACPGCGRSQLNRQPCPDCQRWGPTLNFHNRALFTLNDAMVAYLQRYKRQGDYRLRAVFSTIFGRAVERIHADLVLIIPVTARALQIRGYHQVAGWFQPELGPVQLALAEKKDPQPHPRHFRLTGDLSALVGKKVLLLDDQYDTGRTLRSAASLLLESGAKSVVGLTLTR